jgi:hypothetical protein
MPLSPAIGEYNLSISLAIYDDRIEIATRHFPPLITAENIMEPSNLSSQFESGGSSLSDDLFRELGQRCKTHHGCL